MAPTISVCQNPVMSRSWERITDYTTHPSDLAQPGLKHLAAVWREQRDSLETEGAFIQFIERLKREWAIETGLIERLYVLDRGITQPLIERGIDAALISHANNANPKSVTSMIIDHQAVVDGIFMFVKGDRPLSTSYIKEMHALITRSQETVEAVDAMGSIARGDLIRGDYKRLPNNPTKLDGSVHQYCPPEHVASEMDRLMEMHLAHQDSPPEVEAAWLHHRFVQIHPFQDGNGRIARALSTLIFVKAGWFPLVVRDRDRDRYLDALEAADAGGLSPVVEYFGDLQKGEFIKALSIARDVMSSVRAEDAIKAVRRQMVRRRDALTREWQQARDIARRLCDSAKRRIEEVRDELTREMEPLLRGATFFVDDAEDHGERSHYFRSQIVEAARKLDYFANMETYRSWTRLVIRSVDHDQSELLVAFHGIGQEFQGVLACSAVCFQRVATGAGERQVASVEPVSEDVFQINYKEPFAEAEPRFMPWLERSMIRALDLWQSTVL